MWLVANYIVAWQIYWTIWAIRKSPIFGLLNIAGLALGIACAAMIFLWVEDELGFDHSVATLLSKEFLQLVVISCLISFPLAWWIMNNWLASYAYRIVIHWWVFGLAGIIALLIAMLTVSSQAIRAALSNPVETLWSE